MTFEIEGSRSSCDWSVLVPIKSTSHAKSRFEGVTASIRRDLAIAMVLDVVDASLACEAVRQVVLVSPEPEVFAAMRSDPRLLFAQDVPCGLNEALLHALSTLEGGRHRGSAAAVTGDLPALTTAELTRALAIARSHTQSFVPDSDGQGTTVYAAGVYGAFAPGFGSRSRVAHSQAGCHRLDFPASSGIRQDVDDMAGLAAALAVGAGESTRHVAELLTRASNADLDFARQPILSGAACGSRASLGGSR